VAVFNRADEAQTLRYGWKQMGLEEQTFMLRDLWEHKELGRADRLEVRLAPHASALYKILPAETH
jgi:hypothetical protein